MSQPATTSSIQEASSAVKKMWGKHGIQNPYKFIGFCLSMLPVPVIQQAGQAVDRHLQDSELRIELAQIWKQITAANQSLERIESVEKSIKTIADTLDRDPILLQASKKFANRLSEKQSEFQMITEDHSYQELVRSIIIADIAQIIANQGSINSVEDSSIIASRTLLHASGGSRNFVRGTTFSGNEGSVLMDSITTRGSIIVQDSSIGLGEGSAIIFGEDPNIVAGQCPNCKTPIKLDRRKLAGFTSIQCPGCKAMLPFTLHLG